jgi:large subunit ribosomal protein L7/L12
MASVAKDNFDVEIGVQQRTLLTFEQRQRKKVPLCCAFAVTAVVSAMVGSTVGPMLVGSAAAHPDHGLDHNTAFKLDKAIVKAFHMSAPALPKQQTASRIPAIYQQTAVRTSNIRMESPAVADVMEKLKGMTLLEASELVKAIEETFDVDASAGGGAMMMAPAAVGGGAEAAPAAEAKTDFDVTLESFPADKKIAVLKVVRGVTGLGLKEAKEFVEAAPKVIKEGVPKTEAEEMKKQLEETGAVVALK